MTVPARPETLDAAASRDAKRVAQEAWLWVDATVTIDQLDRACQSGYALFLATPDGLDALADYMLPQRVRLAVVISDREQLPVAVAHPVAAERLAYVVATGVDALPERGFEGRVGLLERVDDHDSLLRVVDHLRRVDLVVIGFKDPTNIPLELVLAEAQSTGTAVAKIVEESEDGTVSLMTMETGADIIVMRHGDLADITALAEAVQKAGRSRMELRPATVTGISHGSMGTRVCVDTTSELGQDEGMILGSTSVGGLMTCSETHYLPYMNLRPFRVNAGALHLYIWGPDDRALYLSDLRAGSQVLAVNSTGETRAVTVGRVKVERRPLLLIEAEIDGRAINTFIQDDWHVRMMGSQGEIRPSSEIRIGDELLGFLDTPGRHVGIRIDETIAEQ